MSGNGFTTSPAAAETLSGRSRPRRDRALVEPGMIAAENTRRQGRRAAAARATSWSRLRGYQHILMRAVRHRRVVTARRFVVEVNPLVTQGEVAAEYPCGVPGQRYEAAVEPPVLDGHRHVGARAQDSGHSGKGIVQRAQVLVVLPERIERT